MKLKPIPNKKQREWMEKHKKKDKSILDYGKKTNNSNQSETERIK